MRNKGNGKQSNITSLKRSLKEKENENENEDDVNTSLIDKYLKENLIGKKKDESLTSLEKINLVCEEIIDILPLPMKRQNNDNGTVYIIMRCVFFL